MAIGVAIAGAVVGGAATYGTAYFGIGVTVGWMLGSIAGSALFPPEGPSDIVGPRIEDSRVTSSSYGKPIPIVYGRIRVAGNIIWSSGLIETEHTEEIEVGGDPIFGWGEEEYTQTTYTYKASFAVGLCEGEIAEITRIWLDGKTWADIRGDVDIYKFVEEHPNYKGLRPIEDLYKEGVIISSSRMAEDVEIYKGTEGQTQSPTIQEYEGTDIPAHRGLAYIVFKDLQLKTFGNRIPNVTVEVLTAGTANSEDFYVDFSDTAINENTVGSLSRDNNGNLIVFLSEDDTIYVFDGLTNNVVRSFTLPSQITTGKTVACAKVDKDTGRLWVASIERNSDTSGDYNRNTLWFYCMDGISNNIRNSIGFEGDFIGVISTNHNPTNVNDMNFVPSEKGNYIILSLVIHRQTGPATGFYTRWMQIREIPDRDIVGDEVTSFVANFSGSASEDSGVTSIILEKYSIYDQWYVWYLRDNQWHKYYCIPNWGKHSSGDYMATPLESVSIDYSGIQTKFALLPRAFSDDYLLAFSNDDKLYMFDHFSDDKVQLTTTTYSTTSLESVLDNVCNRAGIVDTRLEYSGLEDEVVEGYAVNRAPVQPRQIIEPLMAVYQFETVEKDGKLLFKAKSSSNLETLNSDDIGAHEIDSDPPDDLIETMRQDMELPTRVDVNYIAYSRDYETSLKSSFMPSKATSVYESFNVPFCINGQQALRLADVLLKQAWQQRKSYKFITTMRYAYLIPTDVVTVESIRLRITGKTMTNGLIEFEAISERDDLYTSEVTYNEVDEAYSYEPIRYFYHFLSHLILDIPIFRPSDDDSGLYFAMQGSDSTWDGGIVSISSDGGASYTPLASVGNNAKMGIVSTALGDGDIDIIDETNTITVALGITSQSLSSITEAQMYEDYNLAAIGSNGNWELINFKTATDNGDGSFTLSSLLRGRYGTEWATSGHSSDEMFVLLKNNSGVMANGIVRASLSGDQIGMERKYKFENLSYDRDDSVYQAVFTNQAVGKKPYAPVQIYGFRDGDGALTITWKRRTRHTGEWRDNANVPLNEESESYEIDIMNGSTVLRTLTATSETVNYTVAQQTTDFGSTQSSIEINIYQISALVGRGYAGNATI